MSLSDIFTLKASKLAQSVRLEWMILKDGGKEEEQKVAMNGGIIFSSIWQLINTEFCLTVTSPTLHEALTVRQRSRLQQRS